MNIGERIKKFRTSNNLYQAELAQMLNVSNKTISSWENNRTEPSFEFIESMCNIFHCSKADLLSDNLKSDAYKHSNESLLLLLDVIENCNDKQLKLITEFAALVTRNNYLSEEEGE